MSDLNEPTIPPRGAMDVLQQSFSLLSRSAKRRLPVLALIQIALALMDLFGVLLITLVGVLAVADLSQQSTLPLYFQWITVWLEELGLNFRDAALLIAVIAAAFLVTKNILSAWFSRRSFLFLARQQTMVSTNLAGSLFGQPLTVITQRHSMATAYALIQGPANAIVGALGSAVVLVSESILVITFVVVLFVVDPVVTIAAVLFLSGLALALQRFLGSWATRIGLVTAQTLVAGNTLIQDTINSYREIYVSNRMGPRVRKIQELIQAGSRASADSAFLVQIPKFVFESALILGAVLLAVSQLALSDTTAAVATLLLFIAAGTRVVPSLMKIQSALINIRGAAGGSQETFAVVRQLEAVAPEKTLISLMPRELKSKFVPSISCHEVSYTYPGGLKPALDQISLDVSSGRTLAFAGLTGSGKSTLADVILGVIEPSNGNVFLGGISPRSAISVWPGSIAYVPQHVMISHGSIRDNVALGMDSGDIDDSEVWKALEAALLSDLVQDRPKALDAPVGEQGIKLSGGQRQRLGLARALYTKPKLLILDEATSALDATTERAITETIGRLQGDVTVVMIAHRLASIREFNEIVYLNDGKIEGRGSFDELRLSVPAFKEQAHLLGL